MPGVVAATTVPVAPPPSPMTTLSVPVAPTVASSNPIQGTVTDGHGQPVPGAYVIGLDSLTVVRTDASGRYSMPCQVTSGGVSGNRREPLVAGVWLLPVEPTGRGGYSYGSDTTSYLPPPTAPGLGYAFSGGAADAAQAEDVSCDGQPFNFILPAGGGADVQFLDANGQPATTFSGPPVDNLYLPGLGDHAALETAPLTSDGRQIVQQLGPGGLNLDILYPMTCTEPAGASGQPEAVNPSDVVITAGQTVHITCREAAGSSSGGSAGSGGSATSTTTAGG